MRTGGGGPRCLVGSGPPLSEKSLKTRAGVHTSTLFDNPMWLVNLNRIKPNGVQMLACTHSHSVQRDTLWWKGPEPRAAVTRGPGVASQSLSQPLVSALFSFHGT